MAYNRPYKSYKYIYTNDFGEDFLRQHREFINNEDKVTVLIPVTTLFLERVVNIKEKIAQQPTQVRRLEVLIPTENPNAASPEANLNQPLPYPPGSNNLYLHILEIVEMIKSRNYKWYCIPYRGEIL